MKKVLFVLGLFAWSSFTLTGLTDAERQFSIKHLQETRDRVLKVTSGLSPEQLNFKSTPESWSVAECFEHIILS